VELVAILALFGWNLSGSIWLGLVASLVIAVVVFFVVNPPMTAVAIPNWLRFVVLLVGLALMLWQQPGLSPIGYHVGDLLLAAGIALLLGLFGWLVDIGQLAMTILGTSAVYAVLVGYPMAVFAGVVAAILLAVVVWLVQRIGAPSAATAG
jgi:hypothetical protein